VTISGAPDTTARAREDDAAMSQHPDFDATLCRLELAFGRAERCRRAECAFWEEGGAVLSGSCAFESVDVSDRPQLAAWLLGVRRALEAATSVEDVAESRRRFYRRLNAGRSD